MLRPLTGATHSAEDAATARKERLKSKPKGQASKQRQAGWENTLSGQRRAKLDAKKERDAAEEAARVEVDLEEEMYRAAQRKKVIDKAKKLQFREQDRAKELHSALLHTEVLKEREYQIQHKVLHCLICTL